MNTRVLTIIPKSKNLKPVSIGGDNPLFTIAEIGLNHNGDINLGKKLIDSAYDAGCTAVKFQNFETDDVYIKGEKAGKYHLLGKDIEIYDLHKNLEIEFDFLSELKKYAEAKGLYFFSAPMGSNALKTLLDLDCDLVKIASYEVSNLPWIRKVAEIQKPIIMSCGGARLEEVDRALAEIYKYHKNVALMHCVIKYPARIEEANLQVINTLKSAFEVPVGFSNNGFKHDSGEIDFKTIPYAAAALGMDLYEIHITLDRKMAGVDQGFSSEPSELKDMMKLIDTTRSRFLEAKEIDIDPLILGSGIKTTLECEEYVRAFAYKSVFTIKAIAKGEKLSVENIKCLRPGEYERGLEPMYFDIINEFFYAKIDIEPFEPIIWENISN
jgi:N-acetylneuraminate synthase